MASINEFEDVIFAEAEKLGIDVRDENFENSSTGFSFGFFGGEQSAAPCVLEPQTSTSKSLLSTAEAAVDFTGVAVYHNEWIQLPDAKKLRKRAKLFSRNRSVYVCVVEIPGKSSFV